MANDFTWGVDTDAGTITKQWRDGVDQPFAIQNLPERSREYLIMRGIREAGKDCHAGAGALDEKRARTTAWWERMLAGQVGHAGTGIDQAALVRAICDAEDASEAEVAGAVAALVEAAAGTGRDARAAKRKLAEIRRRVMPRQSIADLLSDVSESA